MSELKVNSIKGVAASTAAITINNTDGTCTANITNKPNRNIIINGAMNIAQRGTSSTTSGYGSVDRFQVAFSNTDEALTQSQVDVAAGTTPYTEGFRKALRATNGNQTSGAGAGDQVFLIHKLEARDIATSGWNYTDSNSFITLSFWVKSSVAQNFHGYLLAHDGTQQKYPYETGSLSANTWTKVTKTIPGNSNLQFDTDTETNATSVGLHIILNPYLGTNYTDSGVSLNAWSAYASGTRTPDQTSTWYTTNDATFEMTGFQLEVGSHSTDFEFKSFGQELALCERYCQVLVRGQQYFGTCMVYQSSINTAAMVWKTTMRATPSIVANSGTNYYITYRNGSSNQYNALDGSLSLANNNGGGVFTTGASGTQGHAGAMAGNNAGVLVYIQAEL